MTYAELRNPERASAGSPRDAALARGRWTWRWPGRRTDWLLLILFVDLQLADVVSTNYALALPGVWEANPLMAMSQAKLGIAWWAAEARSDRSRLAYRAMVAPALADDYDCRSSRWGRPLKLGPPLRVRLGCLGMTPKSDGCTTETQRAQRRIENDPPRDPLTNHVIGFAIGVHRELGPGLLESAYEECLCFELKQSGIAFARQAPLAIAYKGYG
jgi:hypothetical protein